MRISHLLSRETTLLTNLKRATTTTTRLSNNKRRRSTWWNRQTWANLRSLPISPFAQDRFVRHNYRVGLQNIISFHCEQILFQLFLRKGRKKERGSNNWNEDEGGEEKEENVIVFVAKEIGAPLEQFCSTLGRLGLDDLSSKAAPLWTLPLWPANHLSRANIHNISRANPTSYYCNDLADCDSNSIHLKIFQPGERARH